ncbi:hypothetical protein D3C86_1639110 [compost metagenome]
MEVAPFVGAVHHEWLFIEIARPEPLTCHQHMPGGQGGDEGFAVDWQVLHARAGQHLAHQANIDQPCLQVMHLGAGDAFAEHQFDVRQRLAGMHQQARDHAVGTHCGETQGQPARFAMSDASRRLAGRLGDLQDATGVFEKALARQGQPRLAVVALEQQHAEGMFQQLDLPAQGRLGHVQAGGGAAEMQLFGHGHEAAQLMQLHDSIPELFDPASILDLYQMPA